MREFYEYLKVVSVLVGYKYSADVEIMLDKVLLLLNKVFNLNEEELNKMLNNIHTLFKINTYNDYKMLISLKDKDLLEILKDSNIYVETLYNKENHIKDFSLNEFKDLVSQMAMKSNYVEYKRFQGILYYLGIAYKQSSEVAIKILKQTAVRGDLVSLSLLSFIDNENQGKYNELSDALIQIYDGQVMYIDELSCDNNTKKLCQLILLIKNDIENSQDKAKQKYSVLEKDSKEQEALNILNGKETVIKKIGF